MRRFIKGESGLTLVEVVVSMLLLSIAILTSLTLLATGMLANDITKDKAVALNIAEREIEKWKKVPSDQLIGSRLDQYSAKLNGELASDPSTPKEGYLKIQVTAARYPGYANLVQINVEVTRHYPNRMKNQDVSLIKLAVVRKA